MNNPASNSSSPVCNFINRWRGLTWGRMLFVAAYLSFLAFLLFAVAMLLTDGEPPRTVGEWLITALWSALAWPVFVVGWLGSGAKQCQELFLWLAWFLGGLFWAVLIELLIFARRERVPQAGTPE